MIKFNTDGMLLQRYPFRQPIMDYILKNVKPSHLIKLYQCCKYFYAKFRLNIILNLEISAFSVVEIRDPMKTVMRLYTRVGNPFLSKMVDFWITDSLIYTAFHLYSSLLPKFTNCSIKKLELRGSHVWEDYEILTKAETVQQLKIMGIIRVPQGNGSFDYASLEKLISRVPNAKSIEIYRVFLTPTTFSTLASLNHKAKISNIIFKGIIFFDLFDIKLFMEFILKHCYADCNVHLHFEKLPDDSEQNRIRNENRIQMGKEYMQQIQAALEMKKNQGINML